MLMMVLTGGRCLRIPLSSVLLCSIIKELLLCCAFIRGAALPNLSYQSAPGERLTADDNLPVTSNLSGYSLSQRTVLFLTK